MLDQSFLTVFKQKEATRFKLKAGVFLFLVQEDHLLMLRRSRTGIEDGCYVVPMGGHDGKEPLTTALIREAEEETNIQLQPTDLQVCHVMHRLHLMPQGLSFEQLDIYFKASRYSGTPLNREPDKCDEVKFCPLNQLPTTTSPCVRHAIECIQKGQFYSEFGWEHSAS